MIVQYAGDYLEAHRRAEAGEETYYGHRYVLEELAKLRQTYGDVAILCCKSGSRYRVMLPSGVLVIGAGVDRYWDGFETMKLIEEFEPTHLVVAGPMPRFIRHGVASKARVLCIFADSFEISAARRLFRYGLLTRLLNGTGVDWIGNHGLNACYSLARIGVKRNKIIAWDWPHERQPRDTPPKGGVAEGSRIMAFAGAVTEHKGVGDLIRSIALLRARGIPAIARIAGAGDIGRFRSLASSLGVDAQVEFLGLIPNTSVIDLMKRATAVVIPSRHEYPEGLPLTIYEALCSRTPIIASDHPMFVSRLEHRTTAMIFKSGRAPDLAQRAEELFADHKLYRALSNAAQATWEGLQIPVKWGDLLNHWVRSAPEDKAWLQRSALASQ